MLRLTQASLRLGVSRTTVRYATTYFTDDHEWCSVDAGVATIGITEHAQELLGDIVYVELPDVGASFAKAEAFGSVESVKTSSECYAPIDGEILEVNEVRRRGVLFSLALVRSLSLSLSHGTVLIHSPRAIYTGAGGRAGEGERGRREWRLVHQAQGGRRVAA